MNSCSRQQALLSAELQALSHTPKTPILRRFWAIAQESLEDILAEHLLVWRNKKRGEDQQQGGQRKLLFSFENASFVSSVNSSSRKKVSFTIWLADKQSHPLTANRVGLFAGYLQRRCHFSQIEYVLPRSGESTGR
jgi:hypothetical protein